MIAVDFLGELKFPKVFSSNGMWRVERGKVVALFKLTIEIIIMIREAIVKKIPEFYEIISQTGRGGQSDFISLIQK